MKNATMDKNDAVLSTIWTISAIKGLAKGYGSHWFDVSSMRFFNSRVFPRVYHSALGLVFISSERMELNDKYPPRYSVRLVTLKAGDFNIQEYPGTTFQQFDSLTDARAFIDGALKAETF